MTDARTASGRTTLADVAPEAARAFEQLVSVRPSGVHDELLQAPAVRAYADQLRTAGPDAEASRAAFDTATGAHGVAVGHMVWIGDLAPRLRSALDGLFGPSDWPEPRRYPVADVSATIDDLNRTIDELHTPAPTTAEGTEAVAALAEAVRETPAALPEGVVARVREHLTDEQAVEVVLDTVFVPPAVPATDAASDAPSDAPTA